MTTDKDPDVARELGELTSAIKFQGVQIGDLKAFVEKHMVEEEKTTWRLYKWLTVLTVVLVATHATEINWGILLKGLV